MLTAAVGSEDAIGGEGVGDAQTIGDCGGAGEGGGGAGLGGQFFTPSGQPELVPDSSSTPGSP